MYANLSFLSDANFTSFANGVDNKYTISLSYGNVLQDTEFPVENLTVHGYNMTTGLLQTSFDTVAGMYIYISVSCVSRVIRVIMAIY